MKARAELGLRPEEPGPLKDKKVKADLQTQYSAVIDDGMKNLQKALDIDPNYDDAMQYLNLNYRRKADMECGNDAARKDDLAQADMWVQKAQGARKINEAEKEKKLGGGVDMTK